MFHGKISIRRYFLLATDEKFQFIAFWFSQVVSLSSNFLKAERYTKNINNLHSEAEEENEKQFMAIFM
jgi:hypothetical protein